MRRLEAASGLQLEAGTVAIDPFRLSVRLEAARLRAVGESGPVVREFSADKVFVNVHKSPIFSEPAVVIFLSLGQSF